LEKQVISKRQAKIERKPKNFYFVIANGDLRVKEVSFWEKFEYCDFEIIARSLTFLNNFFCR
jgi:hypothetical protein